MGNLQNRDHLIARKPNAISVQRYTDNAVTATKLRRFSPRVLNATLEKRKENGCPAAAQRLERAQLTAAPRVRASGRPPIRAACGPGGLPRAQTRSVFFASSDAFFQDFGRVKKHTPILDSRGGKFCDPREDVLIWA